MPTRGRKVCVCGEKSVLRIREEVLVKSIPCNQPALLILSALFYHGGGQLMWYTPMCNYELTIYSINTLWGFLVSDFFCA